MGCGRQLRVSRFVSVGMDAVAPSHPAPENMLAPVVAALTLCRTAASNSFLPIITPFCWQKWKELLAAAGTLSQFTDVPEGIRFGWRIGVPDSYSLSSSYIPPNHNSALKNIDFLLDYIDTEVRKHRYSGPFSPSHLERIIGPFCTSPLGVIPKPGSSKFRLIQDHSFLAMALSRLSTP